MTMGRKVAGCAEGEGHVVAWRRWWGRKEGGIVQEWVCVWKCPEKNSCNYNCSLYTMHVRVAATQQWQSRGRMQGGCVRGMDMSTGMGLGLTAGEEVGNWEGNA